MRQAQPVSMAKRKSKTRPSRSTRKQQMDFEMRQTRALEEIRARSGRDPYFDVNDAWDVYSKNGFTDAQIRQIMMGSSRMARGRPRRIDNQQFWKLSNPVPGATGKRAAQSLANMQRINYGVNARVIESKDGWSVWTSSPASNPRPVNRAYSATLDERIAAAEYRGGQRPTQRSWWQRLTTRRRKTTEQRTRERLDEEELADFFKFREQLLREGKSEGDAYADAKAAAQLNRQDSEALIGQSAEAERLRKRLREAQDVEDQKNYEYAVESYNEGVPLSTVAKYNGLEIATTSTGLAVGAGLAATSVATAGIVPIAALVGFFTAKVVRNNVGGLNLKRGVNSTLDAVERGTSGAIEAVRVSKDKGQPNPRLLWLIREPSREKPKKPKSLKELEREERRQKRRDERDRQREIRRNNRNQRKLERLQAITRGQNPDEVEEVSAEVMEEGTEN